MIVWLKNAHFAVVDELNHTRLFDRGADLWNRSEHPPPFWRVPDKTYFSRL